MFLNGALWHSGTEKFKPINVTELSIGGGLLNDNLYYYGGMDEVQIFNKALDETTIAAWMNKKVDASHPNYDALMLYYDFNAIDNNVINIKQ